MAQRFSAEQRRALAMLADAGHSGCTDQLRCLRLQGRPTRKPCPRRARDRDTAAEARRRRMIEVALVRITDAGRQAVSN
jgi:hypothetical protein